MTGALKAPFSDGNPLTILVFACGALLGLMSFSRILHWFLTRHHAIAVSLLTGFMAGAMRKVWPWKEVLESRIVGAREIVIREQNVLPGSMDGGFWFAVALILVGFLLVLALERLSGNESS
jgi:putative membrane protein